MIRWLVKIYLNKKYRYWQYQILSLEQELGYTDHIETQQEIELLQAHKEAIWYKNNLEVVIEKVI